MCITNRDQLCAHRRHGETHSTHDGSLRHQSCLGLLRRTLNLLELGCILQDLFPVVRRGSCYRSHTLLIETTKSSTLPFLLCQILFQIIGCNSGIIRCFGGCPLLQTLRICEYCRPKSVEWLHLGQSILNGCVIMFVPQMISKFLPPPGEGYWIDGRGGAVSQAFPSPKQKHFEVTPLNALPRGCEWLVLPSTLFHHLDEATANPC